MWKCEEAQKTLNVVSNTLLVILWSKNQRLIFSLFHIQSHFIYLLQKVIGTKGIRSDLQICYHEKLQSRKKFRSAKSHWEVPCTRMPAILCFHSNSNKSIILAMSWKSCHVWHFRRFNPDDYVDWLLELLLPVHLSNGHIVGSQQVLFIVTNVSQVSRDSHLFWEVLTLQEYPVQTNT